jgi:hypothetical protein
MDLPRPYSLQISPEQLLSSYARGDRTFHWAELADANLARAQLSGIDLSDAVLRGADLRWANLEGAVLQNVDLRAANLSCAKLARSDLKSAYLSGAKLNGADLGAAILGGADLRGADLEKASLVGAHIEYVSFADAKADGLRLGDTRFVGVELGGLCAARCEHEDTCSVDLHTLIQSRGTDGLRTFLRRCGLAAGLAARAVTLVENSSPDDLKRSTRRILLAHVGSDEAMAAKLCHAFEERRVTMFPKPWSLFAGSIFANDCCLILLCSEAALSSRSALSRLMLFRGGEVPPFLAVALDDYVERHADERAAQARSPFERVLWTSLGQRIVADFSGRESCEPFDAALERLFAAVEDRFARWPD